MKRWIIKFHCTALECNKHFAGEVRDYYYGKGNLLLHRVERTNLGINDLNKYMIQEYGYVRKSGAVKALNAYRDLKKSPGKHWDEQPELIEVDV